MFFDIQNNLAPIELDAVTPDTLVVGIITGDELPALGQRLGLDADTLEAGRLGSPLFRTDVDVRENYTFARLRIVNRSGEDDFISVFILKNFLLVVDIFDRDESTRTSFLKALQKFPSAKAGPEKLFCHFVQALLSESSQVTEHLRNELAAMEEAVVSGKADQHLNVQLLNIKKRILKYYNYYSQILDIAETLEDNDNEIFASDKLIYIGSLRSKVSRMRDDMNLLSNMGDHLQDAYNALLDQRMNSTMKVFTVITTIFFPLTIIVGWYGMNFTTMPELTWRYGYAYVIVLSVAVVALLVALGRRRHWF